MDKTMSPTLDMGSRVTLGDAWKASFLDDSMNVKNRLIPGTLHLDPIGGLFSALGNVICNMTGDGGARLTVCEANPWTITFRDNVINVQMCSLGGYLQTAPMTRRQQGYVRRTDANRARNPYIEAIDWMRETTGLSIERIAHMLGVSRQTLHAWLRGATIADGNKRQILATSEILKRAAIGRGSPVQLSAWLDGPQGIDAKTPAQLLAEGKLDKVRFLAIAKPSPKVVPPATWTRRAIPERFQSSLEERDQAYPLEQDDNLFAEFGNMDSQDD